MAAGMHASHTSIDMTSPKLLGRLGAQGPDLTGPNATNANGLMAAVDGSIAWRDPELARRARELGQAAALLAAAERHGERILEHVGGHFALVLFDTRRQQALLACDRMGTRPLAYAVADDGTFWVASAADVVARHASGEPELDPQSLYHYAFFHMVPSPGTIYRDVFKVEPASCVRFQAARVTATRYWQPAYPTERASEEDLARRLKQTLQSAVQRCEPDDTAGAFLSGGLDSSTVAGMLAQQRPGASTFSIGFAEAGYDETSYARISSKHFATKAHEYYVQPDDIVEAVQRIAHSYDEPFGNSSAVPTLFCARLARSNGMRRLLAGDGGDEIFGGNERYAKQKVFEKYFAIPSILRAALIEPLLRSPLGALPGPFSKARSYMQQALVRLPMRLHTYNHLLRVPAVEIFDAAFLSQVDTGGPARLLTSTYAAAPTDDDVDRMLYLDWKFTLADNDLRKVNQMCEAEGIEVLYPMLDDELVDLSLEVSPDLKVHGTQLRYFYKRALGDFLPREVLQKSKHGFGLPFGEWLRKSSRLQQLVDDSLRTFAGRGIVNEKFIATLMTAHREDHAAFHGGFVWLLVALEQWLQAHPLRAGYRDAPSLRPTTTT